MADVVPTRLTDALAAFDDHAVAIAKRQYFQEGDGDLLGMFRRVADWVARPEPAELRAAQADRFFDLMVSKRFCPGGRVLAGAATAHGNVLNCFVQDGRPEVEGSDAWVLELATKLAVVTKVGGGNGLNLDPLVPRRAYRGPSGRLYLTISPSHPDYEKVRDGTFMDLVHGTYVTRGYHTARFVEYHEAPVHIAVKQVGDSVESIWAHAGEVVTALLAGDDLLLDLSGLRAEGTPVNGSGGSSSGPSSFAVEVFDNFARWANLGGAAFAGPVATLRYVFSPTLRVIRQGGCLVPDTLVHTSRGTLRLEELVDPYQGGWQDHHLKVATDDGWKDSTRGFNNGNAPTKVVKLANGQVIQGTDRHRLKVLRPDGRREWVQLQDLQAGDHVVTVLDQHTGGQVSLRPVAPPHHNATVLRLPEVLGERLGLFLGLLWGDGFVADDRVGIAVAHGSPLERLVPELAEELFGLRLTVEQKSDDASAVFVAKASHLIAWLRANGLAKPKARALELPRAVRSAPRPVVAAFLRGLFETDGTLSHGFPELSTASARLAQDVAVMLGGLGIPATVRCVAPRDDRYSRRAIHRVRLQTRLGLQRFVERVGFVAGSRLAIADGRLPANDRSWPLPHGAELARAALVGLPAGAKGRPAPHAAERLALLRYARGDRQLTRDAAVTLASNAVIAEHLALPSDNDFSVRVKGVTEGARSLTLDISVDDNKTYLANGVVSHNTRRGAGMATISITHPDVHDFITSKDLEREQAEGDISTFNISVLVSDEFMQSAQAEGPQGVLWEIAQHAWQTGEPGLIYVDRINEFNPLRSSLGEIKSTNPCVTADTWVMTHQGARRVADLVDRDFCAVVDGVVFPLESRGFFHTGIKPVVKLRTVEGFELRLTRDHRVKRVTSRTRARVESEWCEAGVLRPGDEVVLTDQRGANAWSGRGTVEQGWLLGMLVGDGTFQADKGDLASLDLWGNEREAMAERATAALRAPGMGIGRLWRTEAEQKIRIASDALTRLAAEFGVARGAKTVSDEIEQASSDFYAGFLQGLFDADGSVQGSQAKGVSVRLAQSDDTMLLRVQRMLARLGIVSTLYRERRPAGSREMPDGRGGARAYPVKAQHELVVANENLLHFADRVGFGAFAKRDRLHEAIGGYVREANRERFVATVRSIDDDGIEDVYDVTVAEAHAFDANGIVAHNCGEIPLFPGEPCDLGAINLAAYVKAQGVGMAGFDVETFREDVGSTIRFLDNVLEVNKFALEDNREMSLYLRRLGLGIMGLADALIRMGFRYDSDEGRAAVSAMINELREAATAASRALAEERGPFPAFAESALANARRNVALLTVAPTGTTSMLMGVSSGVEPIFAPFIYRKIGSSYAALVAPLFRELLERHAPAAGFAKGGAWDWEKVVEAVQENHGSVQGLDFVPDDVKAVLVCAHDIASVDHVKMQGVVQTAFDGGGEMVANSISKTINLPNEAKVDDVYEAYSLAFATGCKGITVYRDGSRQFQVLSTKAEKGEMNKGDDSAVTTAGANQARPTPSIDRLPGEPLFDRPSRLAGFTDAVKLTLPTGEKRGFYVTVNKQDGLPVECFITSGKAGDEANADSEALGRVVSIALQYGVPATALVKTLRGINGGMYGTYEGRLVASRADLIAVALETAGVENVLQRDQGCPDCGAPLRFEEGCMKCESCGYSKCG